MIRVLRILEYTYDDNTRAEQDMSLWKMPAVGVRRYGDMTLRSSVIFDLDPDPIPEEGP